MEHNQGEGGPRRPSTRKASLSYLLQHPLPDTPDNDRVKRDVPTPEEEDVDGGEGEKGKVVLSKDPTLPTTTNLQREVSSDPRMQLLFLLNTGGQQRDDAPPLLPPKPPLIQTHPPSQDAMHLSYPPRSILSPSFSDIPILPRAVPVAIPPRVGTTTTTTTTTTTSTTTPSTNPRKRQHGTNELILDSEEEESGREDEEHEQEEREESATGVQEERKISVFLPPRKRRKRMNGAQRSELEKFFAVNQHPSRQQKAQLASSLGVTVPQIQAWFHNQRSRQRRQQQQNE